MEAGVLAKAWRQHIFETKPSLQTVSAELSRREPLQELSSLMMEIEGAILTDKMRKSQPLLHHF